MKERKMKERSDLQITLSRKTEGAVQPARRLAPEHNPCMTMERSTTARWNRLGVDFAEGGKLENRYLEKKPSE